VLGLQRTIGNRATSRLLQRQEDEEDDTVDPELADLYIRDRATLPLPTLADFMPALPQRATVTPALVAEPKQVVYEHLPVAQNAVLIPAPPEPEPEVEPEPEPEVPVVPERLEFEVEFEAPPAAEKKKKKKKKKGKGKAAETAPPTPAAATPAAPKVPIRDIRIPGLGHGTLVGSELRIDGAKVATVSAEQRSNTAGDRDASHQVPLDILADATSRAMNRLKDEKADEKAGGNFAYFWPVGDDYKSNTWLCVVLNKYKAVVTSYTTSRREVGNKTGRSDMQIDAWAKDKKVYPSWSKR